MGVPYFGVTRFSIYRPRNNDWEISKEDELCYQEKLFADDRLRSRIDLFANIALPIYERFSETYDYQHLLLYSEELPFSYKQELFSLKRKYDFLDLIEVPPVVNPFSHALDCISNKLERMGYHGLFCWFRIDDDDFLPANFLDMLKIYVSDNHVGFCISFGKGISAIYLGGVYRNLREVYWPKFSAGQAFVGNFDLEKKSSSLLL